MRIRAMVIKEKSDGYVVMWPVIPSVMGRGKNPEEAVKDFGSHLTDFLSGGAEFLDCFPENETVDIEI